MLQAVSPFKTGPALEALRNEGHDFTSALGEAIDNSFGHGEALEVRIKLEWHPPIKNKHLLKEVHIADNGSGMDPPRLRDCLVLGFSTTYNKRDQIGRFGFGMTVGAIGQCRKIEVWSKARNTNTDFYCVVLDLDEFRKGKDKIDPPVQKKIPKEYEEFLRDHGTLVIWQNIDKVPPFDRQDDLDKLHYDLGRIYRKFIAREIIKDEKIILNHRQRKIIINGKKVIEHDPLYHIKVPGFENDPRSELYPEINIECPLHHYDYQDTKKETGDVIIRMSFLPKEFREEKGIGGVLPGEKSRHIPENEGISILRMDREVYYGPIRGIGPRTYDAKDRWWGMEISFNPELDGWFTVKTVKKGAMPIGDLKKEIDKRVNSTISRIRNDVSEYWEEKETQRKKERSAETSGHERAEGRFEEAGIGKPTVNEIPTEEQKKIADEMLRRFAKTEEELERLRERWDHLNIKWFNDFDLTENDLFMDINPKGGTTALTYNFNHPFFRQLSKSYEKLQQNYDIKNSNDWSKAKEEIMQVVDDIKFSIDALLGSYSAAAVIFRPEVKQEVGKTLSLLLSNWGAFLKVTTLDE